MVPFIDYETFLPCFVRLALLAVDFGSFINRKPSPSSPY